jgi:single-strand DNA-binding protein
VNPLARNTVPITIVGNVTRDPELKFTAAGKAIVGFGVAVNPRRYDKDKQEWVEGEPSFYRCSAFGPLAENIANCIGKGTRVIVTGDLFERRWEENGEKKSGWQVNADAVGPDLSWAQAKVQKMARSHDVPPDDPWATASSTRPEPATAGAPF